MPTAMAEVAARERFNRSVTRAQISDLLSLITGENTDLVNYHEVANRLQARQQIEMGTQSVPLDQIVGSVGRYRDFTRTFLPRSNVNLERWARLDAAMNSMEGFPPVELFKIGEVYFVRDGNHRVSVARANGLTHIEAYVTEVKTDIPLILDDFERDQWIIKAERAEFVRKTKLDEIRPDHDIRLTEPGRYAIMLRHIEVHQYFHNLHVEQEGGDNWMDWPEAVASWYDSLYMPVVYEIRRYDLLDNFPERTEADLYLWIGHHRERLAAAYGLAPLDPDEAVSTFVELHGDSLLQRTVKGLRLGLHRILDPDGKPLGMTDEEFRELRARHDAGELTLLEVEAQTSVSRGNGAETEHDEVDESAGDHQTDSE